MDVDDEGIIAECSSAVDSQFRKFRDECDTNPLEMEKRVNLLVGRSVLVYSVNNRLRGTEDASIDFDSMAMAVIHQQVMKNWSRHVEYSNFYDRAIRKMPRANPYATELRQTAEALTSQEFVDSSFYERSALIASRKIFDAVVKNNVKWKANYRSFQENLSNKRRARGSQEVNDRLQEKRKELNEKIRYLSEFITRLAAVTPLSDKGIEAVEFIKNIDLPVL